MAREALKRFSPLLLCVLMVSLLLPIISKADTIGDPFSVEGLTVSSDSATCTALSANSFSASLSTSGCTSTSTATLTLSSTKTNATLSFKYEVTITGTASVSIGSTTATDTGSYSDLITSDLKITLSCTAASSSAGIKITEVSLVADTTPTVTFIPADSTRGSYTVNGEVITSTQQKTNPSSTDYLLKATAASDYRFYAWYNGNTQLSKSDTFNFKTDTDATIRAEFVPKSSPVFSCGGQEFLKLDDAVSYAQSQSDKVIVLVGDGTLPAGNYTIPAGITLLIPYNDTHTLCTTIPESTGRVSAAKNQKPYVTLTMAAGASIVVDGAISVSAAVSSNNSSYTGLVSGSYGRIYMDTDSSISLNSTGKLYCWGYITGNGEIVAKSGSTVYEAFQIADYRGGSATSTLNSDKKVFPFSQYYVQSIEASLTIEFGAAETAVCRLYSTSYTKADVSVPFISSSNNGMFNISSGGSFRKTYDPATERVTYEVNGDASLSSITINAGARVDSINFNLPIMGNTTVHIQSGTTTLNQGVCLIPGAELIIDEGASANIASGVSVFVYDRSDWVYKEWDTETVTAGEGEILRYSSSGFIIGGTDFRATYYTPSRNADNSKCWTSKFTGTQLKDVRIDINGTLQVTGNLYTTEHGADIVSTTGNGSIIFSNDAPGNTVTNQYMQSRKEFTSGSGYTTDAAGYKEIAATPAQLHNANGSYTATAGKSAGTTIYYFAGRWGGVTVAFDANGGSGTMASKAYDGSPSMASTTLPDSTFTPPDSHVFAGWNTAADGSGVSCKAGDEVATALADAIAALGSDNTITLYAQWEKVSTGSVTISWGALHYEYTPTYTWDPETLRYGMDGSWAAKGDTTTEGLSAGQVKVDATEYDSNIIATLSFAPAAAGWTPAMTFTAGQQVLADGKVTVTAGTSVLIDAALTGKPTADPNGASIGSITITLSKQE